jgi:hypothetical protein
LIGGLPDNNRSSAYTFCEIKDKDRGRPDPLRDTTDWSDAQLLSEGFAANLTTLRALQQRLMLSNAEAAAMLCVSERTYRRWLVSGQPDPTAVRLLAILAGYVPWDGWDGWEVHNGYLFPPGYSRGGIRPGEFFAVVFYRQQVAEYQRVNRQLAARVQALELAASGAPAAELPAELSKAIADLGARVQAVSADLLALGARTCNTGTLCHEWHSGVSGAEVSALVQTTGEDPERAVLRVANAG